MHRHLQPRRSDESAVAAPASQARYTIRSGNNMPMMSLRAAAAAPLTWPVGWELGPDGPTDRVGRSVGLGRIDLNESGPTQAV